MTQTIIDPETGEIAPPSTATGRVTIDDVRAAIGDTDPDRIGASRVRTMLGGRGSYETIQRHLATLRAEAQARAAPPDPTAERVPVPPQDAVAHIWSAAWHAARTAALARAELLAAERDAALARIQVLESDIADQAQALDDAQRRAERQVQEVDEVRRGKDLADAVAAQRGQAAEELVEALAAQERAAAHAAELAEAGRAALRAEMQHLLEQVSELKAALYQRAQASPPAA